MDKLIPLLLTDIPETLEKGDIEIITWAALVAHHFYKLAAYEELTRYNYFEN
jgi:hypothetical protein